MISQIEQGYSMDSYNFEKLSKKDWIDLVRTELSIDSPETKLSKLTYEDISYPALELYSGRVATLRTFPKKIKHISYSNLEKKDHIDLVDEWHRTKTNLSDVITAHTNSNKIALNAGIIHNSGASVIDELVLVLSLALQFPTKKLRFVMAASSKQFLTMAKFRALRFIWEKICDENKLNYNFDILAITSLREFTLYDERNNTLRACAAVAASMMGGADYISVLAHDRLKAQYNDEISSNQSLRLADNIFHILDEESHLAKVSDPGRGSFAIEFLTWQIIDKVVERLSEHEGTGFKNYWEGLPNSVKKLAQKRYADVENIKHIVTGVNSYSNPEERFIKNKKETKYYDGGEGHFPLRRLATEFETLRIGFEKISSNFRGIIYCLGDQKKLTPRINFCKNYFEVAGIPMQERFSHDEDLEKCLASSTLVVFCAIDEDYPKLLTQTEKIKKYTPHIYIAGRVDAGVLGTREVKPIFMGQNMFEVLKKLMQELMK